MTCAPPRRASRISSRTSASYKASALRSCIIATWLSVVFDVLHKLRELELSGDKQAKAKLEEFEAIRGGGESKLKEALEFERAILTSAEVEFELLTPVERQDLDRLQEDRNRCAHPSMQSKEEPYQPSAELARTHLRNAVEYLLSREPVQGKAAFDRLVSEIKSRYFPTVVAEARQHFDAGPLRRARKPLVRALVIGISKSLLRDSNPPDERARQLAAIGAILEMHRPAAEEVVTHDLPPIMAGVAAEDLWKLIAFCGAIPLAWDSGGSATQATCTRYLETVDDQAARPKAVAAAFRIPSLREKAKERLNQLTTSELGDAIAEQPVKEFVALAISKFGEAGGFRQTESLMERLIVPLTPILEAADISEIVTHATNNGQIWDASGVPEMLLKLLNGTARHHAASAAAWQKFRSHIKGISSSR
jgi:hypothetical protein